jgi:hypothetical protein
MPDTYDLNEKQKAVYILLKQKGKCLFFVNKKLVINCENEVAAAPYEIEYLYKEFIKNKSTMSQDEIVLNVKLIGDAISACKREQMWTQLKEFIKGLSDNQLESIEVISFYG